MYTPEAVRILELCQDLQAIAEAVDKAAKRPNGISDRALIAVGQDIRRAKFSLHAWADRQPQAAAKD